VPIREAHTQFARICFRPSVSLLLCACLASAAPAHAQKDPTPLFGSSGVTYSAVRQGGLGSCFFHASVAAIARTNPDALRNAIQQTAPDTFVVTFATGAKETVDLEDVLYARAHGYDHSDGLWVAVLLRGYGQVTLRNALLSAVATTAYPDSIKQLAASLIQQNNLLLNAYDRAIRATVEQSGDLDSSHLVETLNTEMVNLGVPIVVRMQVNQFLSEQTFLTALGSQIRANGELFGVYRSVGQGGFVRRVLEAFGGKVTTVGFQSNVQDAKPGLRLVHAGKTPAVATTRDAQPADSPAGSSSWWVPTHAFTVLDYDEASDSVTLRNPWGDHPGTDGVFQLSYTDFLRNYDFMDYASY
jgi:Calpain family cysteine protease